MDMSKTKSLLMGGALVGALVVNAATVRALAQQQPEIKFQNHRFEPQTVEVPAGQKLTVKVVNASSETIEFESFKLNREKTVSPGESISVSLPALDAGSYDFYDDFHQDVPEGSIVAK
jgi:plastocyanin